MKRIISLVFLLTSSIFLVGQEEQERNIINEIFRDTTDHHWVIKTAISRYNLSDYTLLIEKSVGKQWAFEVGGGLTYSSGFIKFADSYTPGYESDYGMTVQSSIRWYPFTTKQLSGFAFEVMARYSTYNGTLRRTGEVYSTTPGPLSKKFKHLNFLMSYQNQLGKGVNYRLYYGLGAYEKKEVSYNETFESGVDIETGNIYSGFVLKQYNIDVIAPSLKVGIEIGFAL